MTGPIDLVRAISGAPEVAAVFERPLNHENWLVMDGAVILRRYHAAAPVPRHGDGKQFRGRTAPGRLAVFPSI
ncbi:hypothetical protein [uncultured Roseibium sp.]|uniref:hypothetical protein n=1 Tax=uncultured Roseibium sp. TaxID=1936171 RepID=UPI0032177466